MNTRRLLGYWISKIQIDNIKLILIFTKKLPKISEKSPPNWSAWTTGIVRTTASKISSLSSDVLTKYDESKKVKY